MWSPAVNTQSQHPATTPRQPRISMQHGPPINTRTPSMGLSFPGCAGNDRLPERRWSWLLNCLFLQTCQQALQWG